MPNASFGGLRVLALESHYAKEIKKLIASYGVQPVIAPAFLPLAALAWLC
jgi:hypothetical protein